jgi:hypothetical protein
MRDRTPRGRINMQPYENRRIGTRSLIAAYGLVLLIPVVLWAITNPVLAGSVVGLVAGTYVLTRVSVWAVHTRPWESGGFALLKQRSVSERDHNT